MSRLSTDAKITGAFTAGAQRAILNPALGGMNGWSPEHKEWINNQAHVSRPAHCVMLEAPDMLAHFADPVKWRTAMKAMFELHSYTIEGLDMELKVDTDTHAIGGSGELQHEVTNTTRGVSAPKHQYVEKYGRPIQLLHEYWIRYGLMDPETKFALLGSTPAAGTGGAVTDMLANWYSATCLYIAPDPLHRHVDKAWLRSNMFPMGAGTNTAKRDLKSGQEITILDIEYAGFMTVGAGVDALAQQILDTMSITKADPFMRAAHVTGIHSDVNVQDWAGYASQLGKVSREANVATIAGANTAV